MSLIVTKRHGPVRVAHAYFEAPDPPPRCDILRLRQVPTCAHGAGWSCTGFDTLLIDLTQSEESLWRSLHGKTRERIRRALKRDELTVTRSDDPDPSEIEVLARVYDRFATEREFGRADRDALGQFRRAGALSISRISHPSRGDLAFHAIIVTPNRARGLLAVMQRSAVPPEEAPLLGRANRLLFWDDLVHFQRRGIREYDFGGLYRKGDDPALARIAEFKLGFGGRVVTEYKCTGALTWRGRVALALRPGVELLVRLARRSEPAAPEETEAAESRTASEPQT
jgi:hypothetical protein